MLKKLLLSLTLGATLFAQHDASLNLNNNDIEVQADIDLGELNQSDYPDTYFFTLSLLETDSKESTDSLISAGFKLRQDVMGVEGLRFGIGFKGVYTKVSQQTFSALPLGAEAEYILLTGLAMPVTVFAGIDYAPSVLSFDNADKYMEKRLELGVQIVEQAKIFVGYRDIDTDYEAGLGDYTYNDEFYIGFRVRF